MRHTPCGYCPPASSGFLRTQRNAFLNPFFSFSARKKRTVSICQEKKEGTVPTVVPEFSQKISASLRPFHPSLLSERASRSARAFRSRHRTLPTFHTPRNPRARPLAARGGSGEPFGRFPRAFFLLPGVFFLAPQKENAVCIPFSEKRKKRMGA